MNSISHADGMQRFMTLGQQFCTTGSAEGATRRPYAHSAGADDSLCSSFDGFVRSDNTADDSNKAVGEISTVDRSSGLHVFTEARFEGDTREGNLVRQFGLAPGVPDGIAVTEFTPGAVNHFQVEFEPQEGYQIANVKGVHIDRTNPTNSYEETLSWQMAYAPGLLSP